MTRSPRTTRLFAAAATSAAAVAGLAAAPAARGAAYTITSLGFTNGYDNYGVGIDSSGRILVDFVGNNGFDQVGLLVNGAVTPLPVNVGGRSNIPGDISPNGTFVTGYGRIAGTDPTAANPDLPFLYNVNTTATTVLPTLGGTNAHGVGVNDSGTVVGTSDLTGDPADANGNPIDGAFAYANGTMHALPALGEPGAGGPPLHSNANSVTAAGLVLGFAQTTPTDANGNYTGHAVEWSADASGGGYSAHDFGSLAGPGGFSVAVRANTAGVIVGSSDTADGTSTHAALFVGDSIVDLGGPAGGYSQAFGIDDQLQEVGYIATAADVAAGQGASEAALFQNGSFYDLNTLIDTPGWDLQEATVIGAQGQILGYGVDPDGNAAYFLLTPTGQAVPEPASLSLAAVGAASLLRRRGRGRSRG